MIGHRYPDDCVADAVLDGPLPVVFDDDDEELDEGESPDTSAGYGSLLSLGAGMRKKQPLLVVDPVEAENEARRVQFVAAQQLVDPDEAEGIDFLADLAQFAEPDAPAADVLAEEIPDADSQAAVDDDVADCRDRGLAEASDLAALDYAIDADTLEADEADAGPGFPFSPVEESAEPSDMPGEVGFPDPVVSSADAEPSLCVPTSAQPAPRSPGHSLRARVPQRQSRRTLADRLVALLVWLTRNRT